MATRARQIAFRLLGRVGRSTLPLADLLAASGADALPARDRDLVHELTLGTLRRRGRLDHVLEPLVDRPLSRLDEAVRNALRLGAYQLLFTRVPAHAAISEAVDLARAVRGGGAGLVNAVLRRLDRDGPRALPDAASDALGWLTTEGSLPPWLAERWLARLSAPVAVARAQAALAVPQTIFRLNPRHADAAAHLEAAGVLSRPLAVPRALGLEHGRLAPHLEAGLAYAQDLGSQLVAQLAAAPGTTLDACAAPGGKALLIADEVGATGRVIAAEPSARRLASLAAAVARWGATNVHCVRADARRPPFCRGFATVLLDAPCTGLGTLARNPDIRWRASPENLQRQSERQRELLLALAPTVEPGGRLVYSTCSLEPEETTDVVAAFLDAAPGFEPAAVPGWAEPFRVGSAHGTCPERDTGDGFYVAVLGRR